MSDITLDDFAEDEKQPEKHLSHSQISAYMRCPVAYYSRYILGVKSAPSAAMVLGSGVHKAFEKNFEQKIVSGKDLPSSAVKDVFRDYWRENSKEAVFNSERDEVKEEMGDEGISMVEKYMDEVSPSVQPVAVEKRFFLKLPGVRRKILGFIDLVTKDEIVVDFKTTKRLPDAEKLSKDHQLSLYSIAYKQENGRDASLFRYDYLLRKSSKGKGKWTEIHLMPTMRNEIHKANLIATYATVERQIDMAEFYPNTDSFLCSAGMCGFYDECQRKILAGVKPDFLDRIKSLQETAQKNLRETGSPVLV